MSAIRWADTIQCDWPECPEQVTVLLDTDGYSRMLPAGWTDLTKSVIVRNMIGQDMRELCPPHSQMTVAALCSATEWKPAVTP